MCVLWSWYHTILTILTEVLVVTCVVLALVEGFHYKSYDVYVDRYTVYYTSPVRTN